MKKSCWPILILLLFLFTHCHKDTGNAAASVCNYVDYRYYKNAKLSLGELSNDYILLSFDTTRSETEIRNFIASLPYLDHNYKYTLYPWKNVVLRFNTPKSCEEISSIITDLEKESIVEFAHYTMKTNDCQSMIMVPLGNVCVNSYASYFYVEVFDPNNLKDLYRMIDETKTVLVEQSQYSPQFFTLKVTKASKGNTLQMANYFYESKLFASSEPEVSPKFPVE